MNKIQTDICIIGGGASGLVAAIKAAQTNPEASIVILEKLPEVGHKVAAAGNGRCNLSNVECPDWPRTSAFFSELGLFTRIDSEGRIYPYSEDGRDVVSILKRGCTKFGVDILTRREVKGLAVQENSDYRFVISTNFVPPKAYWPKEEPLSDGVLKGIKEDAAVDIESKMVLISTGGKSKPKMGTTGDGYLFAKSLGHTISPLIPVLTGIEVSEFKDSNKSERLSGIRQKCRISLKKNDETIFQEDGEVQFTDYGISGICVFNMSRFIEGRDFSPYEISIDFAPEFQEADLTSIANDGLSLVKAPLAMLIKEEGKNIKSFSLHPTNLRGWDMAQVTRGGVPLEEINQKTGESILIPGLYFSGEMIDQDFMCGGFNLQNAWTTGLRTGEAMGLSVSSAE